MIYDDEELDNDELDNEEKQDKKNRNWEMAMLLYYLLRR